MYCAGWDTRRALPYFPRKPIYSQNSKCWKSLSHIEPASFNIQFLVLHLEDKQFRGISNSHVIASGVPLSLTLFSFHMFFSLQVYAYLWSYVPHYIDEYQSTSPAGLSFWSPTYYIQFSSVIFCLNVFNISSKCSKVGCSFPFLNTFLYFFALSQWMVTQTTPGHLLGDLIYKSGTYHW